MRRQNLVNLFFLCILAGALCTLPASLLGQVRNNWTVQSIRDTAGHGNTIVTFSRSQRFYRLPDTCHDYRKYMKLLQWSLAHQKPLTVLRANETTNVLSGVRSVRCKK